MMDATMVSNKFGKISARANSIEKRRCEREIQSFDNAKRAMAVDMRKAQSEYKKKLLFFKTRQKELMMSKSGASLTESSMGEFLLQSLVSRQSASPRRRNKKPEGRTEEDIDSWRKDLPKSADPSLGHGRQGMHSQGSSQGGHTGQHRCQDHLSTSSAKPATAPGGSHPAGSYKSNPSVPSLTLTPYYSGGGTKDSINSNNNNNTYDLDLSDDDTPSTQIHPIALTGRSINRPASSSYSKDRKSSAMVSISENRPKTSSTPSRVKIVEPHESRPPHPATATSQDPVTSAINDNSSYKRSSTAPVPSLDLSRGQSRGLMGSDNDISRRQDTPDNNADLELISLSTDECPEEFSAEEELGRISNRHRSKLDLRPGTAWKRLQLSTRGSSSCRPLESQDSSRRNPFVGMKGALGQPWKQVRYLDDDEIEERGMFYKLLVKDRLQKETARFESICARVNEFSVVSPLQSKAMPVKSQ